MICKDNDPYISFSFSLDSRFLLYPLNPHRVLSVYRFYSHPSRTTENIYKRDKDEHEDEHTMSKIATI